LKTPNPDIQQLLIRGRDIIVFAEELLGLRLNVAQTRWLRYAAATQDGWRWGWKRTIHVAANQIGKTLGVAVLLLWGCCYKIGADPSDPKSWFEKPYLWLHLAPTQQQAYHALADARMLAKGSHPAQVGKVQFPAALVSEAKVATYYDGLEFYNGAVCMFRSSDDKAAALQGYKAAAISFDEAAFEDHLNSIVNETLMMRLIASAGPLHMVSTPNGMNDYFDLVEEIRRVNESPEERVWVDDENRAAVCWSVITDNVGFGITQAEVDRMEATLDPATKEQQLRGAFLEPAEAFFVPGENILACFTKKLAAEDKPKPGHRYVIFWDPSVSSDPTAVLVIDITTKPWVGVYFRHYIRPMSMPALLNEMASLHFLWNSARHPQRLVPQSKAITGYDATSMGGAMFKQMLREIQPSRALNFGGPDKKLKSLTALRAVMTRGDLLLPDAWTRVRQEVLNYRLKDDKLRQDCVMALDGAVDVALSSMAAGSSIPMRIQARTTPTQPWR
jgi:hypothetical protein